MVKNFSIEAQDGEARACHFELPGMHAPHSVETPLFMPVGTRAAVKGLLGTELAEIGSQIVLGNTYHLYLRPGHERIARLGGLHKFSAYPGPMLTDSGGFQVFSLAALRSIDDHGVCFRSHLDGSRHFMTPELSMEIQKSLGADIVMAFDECPPYPATRDQVAQAMKRTKSWARRGQAVALSAHQCRFGIIQGGLYEDLRQEALGQIMEEGPWDGMALGGLSIGESPELMQQMTHFMAPQMPSLKPRYLMGVGRPEDLIAGVVAGIDMFDCVMPTRNARNGQVFTHFGKMNIKNARFADQDEPLDSKCHCFTCATYSRAYLRHLFICGEPNAGRLLTFHNLSFYISLMKTLRAAILRGELTECVKSFYRNWNSDVRVS